MAIRKFIIMNKIFLRFAYLGLFTLLLSCGEARWFTVSTRLDIPLYQRPPRPGDGFLWIEGEWFWNGSGYHWRDGYWAQPHNGFRWNPGDWKRRPNGWYWQPGRWRR
jgi:hypothetical protein